MAVYTQVSVEALTALLRRLDLGALRSFRGIAEGVENSNYLIETDQSRYILTLYEKRVDEADLPFFLGLMEHLASAGIACPLPIRGPDGTALFELAGRPGAVISYLDGVSVDDPTPDMCHQLGDALAQLHAAQEGFTRTRANTLSLDGWRDLADQCMADDVAVAGVSDDIAPLIKTELDELSSAWNTVTALPQGIIHADLFPDNVFFLNGQLSGIIDFYFACNDALAYDIAICINAWCFDLENKYQSARVQALLNGYQQRRSLSAAETHALGLLCRGAALRFLLTRLYDWLNPAPGALVKPKDPMDYFWRLVRFRDEPDLFAGFFNP